MGITDKMSQLVDSVHQGVRSTSISLVGWSLKLVTAFLLSLTLAMVGQELMGYGTFSFVFVMTVVIGFLIKLMARWSVGAVLLFDLVCVLMALLLRMYILIAP